MKSMALPKQHWQFYCLLQKMMEESESWPMAGPSRLPAQIPLRRPLEDIQAESGGRRVEAVAFSLHQHGSSADSGSTGDGTGSFYRILSKDESMLETARETTGPRVRQISFFLQNRVGALLGVARKLEELNIHICAVSIQDSADHAVIRMVVDRPSLAKEALVERGLNVFENELVAVELPVEKGIGLPRILSDTMDTASQVLKQQGLVLVGQDQIAWE
jgi:hypothetical protein